MTKGDRTRTTADLTVTVRRPGTPQSPGGALWNNRRHEIKLKISLLLWRSMLKTCKFPLTLKPLVMFREEEGETIVLCASYDIQRGDRVSTPVFGGGVGANLTLQPAQGGWCIHLTLHTLPLRSWTTWFVRFVHYWTTVHVSATAGSHWGTTADLHNTPCITPDLSQQLLMEYRIRRTCQRDIYTNITDTIYHEWTLFDSWVTTRIRIYLFSSV